MFLINLVFALFNVVKYVCRMRDHSMLVILFYLTVFICCVCHIALFVILTIDPTKDPFIYDSPVFEFYKSLEWLGSCSMLSLNWLVCITMYQLTVSIRVIFGVINKETAQKFKCTMYIFAGFMVSVQLLMIALIPSFLEI